MGELAVPSKQLLVLEGTLHNYRRRVDESVALTFETAKEMSSEAIAEIDAMRKKTGYICFALDATQIADAIPKKDSSAAEGAPMSVQLRYWLGREWETYQPDITKEVHYQRAMLDCINDVKSRLPRGGY